MFSPLPQEDFDESASDTSSTATSPHPAAPQPPRTAAAASAAQAAIQRAEAAQAAAARPTGLVSALLVPGVCDVRTGSFVSVGAKGVCAFALYSFSL